MTNKMTSVLLAAGLLMMSPTLSLADDHDPGDVFNFALIGDAPYGDDNVPAFFNLVDEINADDSVEFVMHAGDIKSGGTRCSDARFMARFSQFQRFDKPFIYTPGDNEWTDCHRTSNGSYHPLERLHKLREIFFPVPGLSTGGEVMEVETQADDPAHSEYVENVLFTREGVVFSTVHVVGSNNDLRPWNQLDPNDSVAHPRADRIAEFENRQAAVISWLNHTFDYAEATDAPGVLVMMQANPNFDLSKDNWNRAGFNAFLEVLYNRSLVYGKPVVLAQGDSHTFIVEKPFYRPWWAAIVDPQVPNFTRVQTFGSALMDWIKVRVDPRSSEVFSFAPRIVAANAK